MPLNLLLVQHHFVSLHSSYDSSSLLKYLRAAQYFDCPIPPELKFVHIGKEELSFLRALQPLRVDNLCSPFSEVSKESRSTFDFIPPSIFKVNLFGALNEIIAAPACFVGSFGIIIYDGAGSVISDRPSRQLIGKNLHLKGHQTADSDLR